MYLFNYLLHFNICFCSRIMSSMNSIILNINNYSFQYSLYTKLKLSLFRNKVIKFVMYLNLSVRILMVISYNSVIFNYLLSSLEKGQSFYTSAVRAYCAPPNIKSTGDPNQRNECGTNLKIPGTSTTAGSLPPLPKLQNAAVLQYSTLTTCYYILMLGRFVMENTLTA